MESRKNARRLKKRRFADETSDSDTPGVTGDASTHVMHPLDVVHRQKQKKAAAVLTSTSSAARQQMVTKMDKETSDVQKEDMHIFSTYQASFVSRHVQEHDEKNGHDSRGRIPGIDEYVEAELEKRLGVKKAHDSVSRQQNLSIDDMALEVAPKKTIIHEDPLTSGMGVVDEVAVSFEHASKNIEEMERAKRRMMSTHPEDQQRRDDISLPIQRHQFPKTFK